ncbi:MAG TPA: allantoate amidohydrolase [Propionibacteriaceae bacterium]|nr:allantoate amidohydrolase [Propionibacteriaceae bacterium]
MVSQGAVFEKMWSTIADIGRDPVTGGYRRFAWTAADLSLREWFAGECASRGLDLVEDRMGNQWAWWGNPDSSVNSGIATGSHLDSVPDGGAFDGPLGVVSALAAIDWLRADGFQPRRPIAVVNFLDEEGARFGVSCVGSRMITGALSPDRARALRDGDGVTMAEAMGAVGRRPDQLGPDPEALARVGSFIELHIEQGRGLIDLGRPIAVGDRLWAHGRWRIEIPGEPNHAGTTRLSDRRDAVIGCAHLVLAVRAAAEGHDSLATIGKINISPGGVNAIAGAATAWLDARAAEEAALSATVAEIGEQVLSMDAVMTEESRTPETKFEAALVSRMAGLLDGAPVMSTGAGHDAGILSNAGVPAAMIFVRNPTGVSHSPAEWAEPDDCLAGVAALAKVLADLAGDEQ